MPIAALAVDCIAASAPDTAPKSVVVLFVTLVNDVLLLFVLLLLLANAVLLLLFVVVFIVADDPAPPRAIAPSDATARESVELTLFVRFEVVFVAWLLDVEPPPPPPFAMPIGWPRRSR
jgi:hypothetical protein